MNKLKTIFLDRDGVINHERKDYVKSISELKIFPNVAKNIKLLKNAGFLIVVITNQSAINRGIITRDMIEQIHESIQNYLKKNQTHIDKFYYCPHTPNENCDCRKPKPGLFHQAISELKIDIESSWMIGDNDSDTDAATSIGCKAIKINEKFSLDHAVKKILNIVDG
jgi:histidinol-phosphate phosphatase family protein